MISNNINILFSFLIYLIFMLSIGIIFYRRTKNLSDYILGGRGLNSWVTAMSAQASDMSGWLLMGLPGYAYIAGLESLWIAIGLGVGTYLNWKFIAKRLRKYTEHAGNSLTIPDYFENRFKDNSKTLRFVSAFFILTFFLIYTSSGFVASAKLFSTVFGLSYKNGLFIGAFIIISYTFLGGFMAVSWTDFFQGMIMFIAIIVIPMAGLNLLGGLESVYFSIKNINPELLNMFTKTDGTFLSIISIVSLLAWGLGYFGQPHILARFMAIRSPEKIKQARHIAMIWVVISLFSAVFIGIMGRAYLQTSLKQAEAETIFIILVNSFIIPVAGGILLAAILAAIMSTADSQLLVTSSAITKDFYKVLFRKKAGPKELIWVSRAAVIVVAIIAYIIALNPKSSVLGLVAYAWAGFGAAFGPLVLISLFWKRMTRISAIGGISVGGIVVIIWKQLDGGIFNMYEIVPGFILSVLAIIIISLVDKKPSEDIIKEFDSIH
jgi:sodium/proline symporter